MCMVCVVICPPPLSTHFSYREILNIHFRKKKYKMKKKENGRN